MAETESIYQRLADVQAKRRYSHHGMTGTKIHNVWKEMKRRCKDNNPKSASYKRKDIAVCDEWLNAAPFIEWAISSGYREGLQLDRVDNSLGYSPENCRWVLPKLNASNRDNNIVLTYNHITHPLAVWAERMGIHPHTAYTRYKRGWSVERILGVTK